MENRAIQVLIAEDHPIARRGLSLLLKDIYPAVIIHEAVSIRQLHEQLRKHTYFDLVLLDLYFNNEPVLPYLSNIKKLYPKLKFLVITAAEVNIMAIRILELGIKGVINKSESYEEIREAIIKVMNEEYSIPEHILENLIAQSANVHIKIKKSEISTLTKRELEILSFVLKGFRIKEISEHLNITRSVVSIHKRNLFEKLGVQTIQELIQWANTNNFPIHI